MKSFTRKKTILFAVTFAFVLAIQGVAAAPQQLPNPVLAFLGQEHVEAGGKQTIRYRYVVANKDRYPAEMFAAAPSLPPCGQNTKSARTWVDIYDQRGKRLHGFCAFTKPDDLDKLWFSMDGDIVPPSYVYIELTDRQTGTKYKSNLAETTQ
ncbi:MAG TPA: hypothetical protein VJT15_15245 [Pyrinomonadaceae bacterium]|nr:hypothetical protein [Pyrinomonadaceae bacterium]